MEPTNHDTTKDAYSITNYDLVYILLKPNVQLDNSYTDIIKYDKSRKRWYVVGKIIEGEGYPKYHMIPFVHEKDIDKYKKEKKLTDKKKYIINISFGYIDFITLPFDFLDWKG